MQQQPRLRETPLNLGFLLSDLVETRNRQDKCKNVATVGIRQSDKVGLKVSA